MLNFHIYLPDYLANGQSDNNLWTYKSELLQNSPVRNSLFKRQKALDTDDPEDVEDPQTRKVLKMKMSNAELAGKLDVDCISLMTEAA
ncbi:hypothetical protein Tco_0038563 [Tanacetum coccineum]